MQDIDAGKVVLRKRNHRLLDVDPTFTQPEARYGFTLRDVFQILPIVEFIRMGVREIEPDKQ